MSHTMSSLFHGLMFLVSFSSCVLSLIRLGYPIVYLSRRMILLEKTSTPLNGKLPWWLYYGLWTDLIVVVPRVPSANFRICEQRHGEPASLVKQMHALK
jgi:hypothetical protein